MEEHVGFLETLWEKQTGRSRLRRVPDFLLSPAERPQLERSRTSAG
jgi:hypothetical protein